MRARGARHNATAAAAILKMNDTAQNQRTKGIRAQKGIAEEEEEEEEDGTDKLSFNCLSAVKKRNKCPTDYK